MSQMPSFERCSVIRHWILCTVHRCALNTNSRHICSRGGDGVCQTLLDSCFLASCQKEFLQRTLPKPDGKFRYSGIAVVSFFVAGRFQCCLWSWKTPASQVTGMTDRHHGSIMAVHLPLHSSQFSQHKAHAPLYCTHTMSFPLVKQLMNLIEFSLVRFWIYFSSSPKPHVSYCHNHSSKTYQWAISLHFLCLSFI